MSFLLGLIIGGLASYLIVSYFAEVKLRIEILEDELGYDKEAAYKWLNNKNPGLGLRKPADLSFSEFLSYVGQIKHGVYS